ncbi:hypothetical protein [Streptomyces sp. NPDC058623]|uniref:hypothetical protein n=1 Tax=Streptomyces sp. NPDC058623 TaxID=3346563 RepID=UPI003667C745
MNDPSTLATTAHDDRDGPPLAPYPTTGPAAAAVPSGPPDPVAVGMAPLEAVTAGLAPPAVVAAGPLPTAPSAPAPQPALTPHPAAPAPAPVTPVAPAPVTPVVPVTPVTPVVPVNPVAPTSATTPATATAPTPASAPTPDRAAPTGPADSVVPSGEPAASEYDAHTEAIRTLLETAATCRPVEEVIALVNLLKQTGQLPNPGHEALRAAAVSRPVHEVRHLLALLGEPTHDEGEADITLRAAAVGRSIEDVALLVSILGPDAEADAEGEAVPRTDRAQAAAPQPPSERDWATPVKRERNPRPTAPRPAPVRSPERPQGPLRHALRWPAAAALLLCGVVHLPGDLTAGRPAPALGDLLPLAVSLLCLGVGALLAVRDTVMAWRVAAVTALVVVTLHVVGGVVFYDPLEHALGGPHAWAGVATVLCAGAGAVIAGLALRYRPDRARTESGAGV